VKKVSQGKAFLIMIFLFTSLTSCGGGGGGSTSSPQAPPAAPVSVAATPRDGYVTLSWSAVSGATTYSIYWSTTSGVTKANGTKIISDSSSLNHSGLVNTTAYYYVVTAVNANGESAESSQATATPVNGASAADPLYGDQWHLKNTGQRGAGATGAAGTAGEDIDVEPSWTACGTGNTCRGEGVRIAVVDDGLEIAHEDLLANVATGLSYNYVTHGTDPTNDPADTISGHGTEVAGIAGARDLNGLGVRGVAPRANLVGYNLLQSQTGVNESDAMTRNAAAVCVSTNSWGAPDGNGNLWPADLSWQSAINYGLANGRGGRGIVYTWAAGNGGDADQNGGPVDNSNYDGQANFRGVMAVAAVNDRGVKSSYSERGANLWVSAPGGEFCDTHAITTTDRTGAVGDNPPGPHTFYLDYQNTNYTKCMNGTSSATPMVAGVAALVLQANPNLGWRDVRVILAKTARKNDLSAPTEWALNGAGYHFNPNYGFGVVDASAAVATAATYTAYLPAEKTYTSLLSSPTLSIPDNNTTGVSNAITVSNSGITEIEFVEITFSAADHPYSGDLEITLTSPAGTSSLLAETHLCARNICTPYSGWVFGSANFLGEAVDGVWTLTVKDLAAVDAGTFQSWSLKFQGI
jgi:proprotein convertase subtilisin/kexin type 2